MNVAEGGGALSERVGPGKRPRDGGNRRDLGQVHDLRSFRPGSVKPEATGGPVSDDLGLMKVLT